MIEIKEFWDERHGIGFVQAVENGVIIKDESFMIGWGSTMPDNRNDAHDLLGDWLRETRHGESVKSFWNGKIYKIGE